MTEQEVPDVWWSPAHGPIVQQTREGSAFFGEYRPANTVRWMEQLPEDAVSLAPATPRDAFDQAYARGHRHGDEMRDAAWREENADRDEERRFNLGNALGWDCNDYSPSWHEIVEGIKALRPFVPDSRPAMREQGP